MACILGRFTSTKRCIECQLICRFARYSRLSLGWSSIPNRVMDPNYHIIPDRPSLRTELSLLKHLQEFRIPVNGKRYTPLRQNGKTPPDTGIHPNVPHFLIFFVHSDRLGRSQRSAQIHVAIMWAKRILCDAALSMSR